MLRIPYAIVLRLCLCLALLTSCERAGDVQSPAPHTGELAGSRHFTRRRAERALPPAAPCPNAWVVEGASADGGFGSQVSAAGDVNGDGFADVLIAEPGFADGRGRVLAYYGGTNGLPPSPSWSAVGTSNLPGGQQRGGAEGIGDLNDDGFDDVVVTAARLNGTNEPPNRADDLVEVFLGSRSGLSTEPAWALRARDLQAPGIVFAGRAGDINADGCADFCLVVTQPPSGTNLNHEVRLVYGSRTGPLPDLKLRIRLTPDENRARPWVAWAGDVNRDGCDDLLIGEPHWSGLSHWGGRALLHHGSRQGLLPDSAWVATYPLPARAAIDENYEQFFGSSASGAGDVNRDGFADVIVGAPFADRDDMNEGLAFAFHGAVTGLSQQPKWFVESNHPYALLGYSVSGAGDVNGDGYDDVIVGAPQAADGQLKEGAALVFLGSARGLSRKPHWSVESDLTEARLGDLVSAAGDVNGDGYADVLVAAPKFKRNGAVVGRVSLHYGSSRGLTGSFNWRIDKPLLTVVQEWLARTSASTKLGTLVALLVVIAALALAWRRALRRALRAERELAAANERTRLARDLHDHLGARLARLSTLSGNAGAGSPELSEAVRDTVVAAQQAVWKVNPAHDTLEGLIGLLLQETEGVFAGTPLRCWTETPQQPAALPLPPEMREHLSLAIREACANILKHAQASDAWLRIRHHHSTLEIVVEDNGVGLPDGPVRSGANGLKNLRARLAALGGEARFGSRTGGGACVSLRVNLPVG